MDLLMATEYVTSCAVEESTEFYWKMFVQSEGIKEWSSFLTVSRTTDAEIWCVIQCPFTPEPQLSEARKYIFSNEWNKEQIFRPRLFVGRNGTIALERAFAINLSFLWGTVYELFAAETMLFLESIDVMQTQLRQEEDAASIRAASR